MRSDRIYQSAKLESPDSTVPQNVLLICKDSVDNFFADEALADNVTSFTATYSSSNENVYKFQNLTPLITHLAQLKTEGERHDPLWTTHNPNWNKMMLIPIHLDQVTTTSAYGVTSTTTIGIQHDMSISSTRLVGGSGSSYEPITLKVAFGKFAE